MTLKSCIPIIPSGNLEQSLKLWQTGLGFDVRPFSHAAGRMTGCMLTNGHLTFMLNIRAGTPEKSDDYEGIRLYWAPDDLDAMRATLVNLGFDVSAIVERDYGRTEFFLTDDDGVSHCFGVDSTLRKG
jgi:hypothetical protein